MISFGDIISNNNNNLFNFGNFQFNIKNFDQISVFLFFVDGVENNDFFVLLRGLIFLFLLSVVVNEFGDNVNGNFYGLMNFLVMIID